MLVMMVMTLVIMAVVVMIGAILIIIIEGYFPEKKNPCIIPILSTNPRHLLEHSPSERFVFKKGSTTST